MPFPKNEEADKYHSDNKKPEDEDLLPGLDEKPKDDSESLGEPGDIEDLGAEETASILGDETAEMELTTKLEALIKDKAFAGSELRKKIDSLLADLGVEEKEVGIFETESLNDTEEI